MNINKERKMQRMNINEEGLRIIETFEGLRTVAYLCPAGIPTIGYGHIKNVHLGDTITRDEAETLLKIDLKAFENHVNEVNEKYNYNFNENEFSALVSFAFNVGSIWQLTNYGRRNKLEISDKMMEYNKGNGVVLAGLVRRRMEERKLFLKHPSGIEEQEIISKFDK